NIERELSLFDPAHDGRRREGLGGRSDLEQRVFIDGKWMAYAGEAEPPRKFASVTGYTQSDTGNFVPLHRGRDQFAYGVEQLFDSRRFTHCKARGIGNLGGGAALLQQPTLISQRSPANQRHRHRPLDVTPSGIPVVS